MKLASIHKAIGGFTFVIFMLYGTAVQSQRLTWGPVHKDGYATIILNTMYISPTRSVVFKRNYNPSVVTPNAHFDLQGFDKSFVGGKSVAIEPELDGKKLDMSLLSFSIKDKIYLFSSVKNQKLKKRTIYLHKVDANTLSMDAPLKVAENALTKYDMDEIFPLEVSEDESHVLIVSTPQVNESGPMQVVFHVFDADMNRVWEKAITFPYAESELGSVGYSIDNQGNVYVIGNQFASLQSELAPGDQNTKYKFIVYSEQGTVRTEYPMALPGKTMRNLIYGTSKQDYLEFLGYYTESGRTTIDGCYYVRMDRKSKEITKLTYQEFEPGIIEMHGNDYYAERAQKREEKGKKADYWEYLLSSRTRPDGGRYIISEQFYTKEVTKSAGGSVTYHMYYFHMDLIVTSFNGEGEFEWTAKIPKFQVSASIGTRYSSYAPMVVDNKLYLLFNDTRKNLNSQGTEDPETAVLTDKNGIIALVSVDATGKVTRKELASYAALETFLMPIYTHVMQPKQYVVVGNRTNKFQFGTLTLP